MLSGAVAGIAATVLMDAVGTLFWERAMSESVQKKEREVEPKFPLTLLGERIAGALDLQPAEKAGERIGTAMHWGIGVLCGALHATLEPRLRVERAALAQPLAMSMLAVDEFAFTAAGLAPPPRAFPIQTHVRAFVAHVTYGIALATMYEGMKRYYERR